MSMAEILDGRKFAGIIKEKVRQDVEELNRFGIDVGLALMIAGENPASRQYYLATVKTAKSVGITIHEYGFPETVSLNRILNAVNAINTDECIHGLLILFPLPRRINSRRVVNAIAADKDVDGLGALSIGRLASDESIFQIFHGAGYDRVNAAAPSGFLPCTPFGVIRLLDYYKVPIKGKHVVIVGKSLAVGKPLSIMFLAREATVTVCHRETPDLSFFTKQADIICSATGVKGIINGDMVRDGAVVVDVGINVLENGSIIGDVDFDTTARKASFITPVPGGVGPVTIAMLLENTVRSARLRSILNDPLSYPL